MTIRDRSQSSPFVPLLVAFAMFREARRGDLDAVLWLYRQLQPADPVVQNGSVAEVFEQILAAKGLHLFVLEEDGAVVATTYLKSSPT